MIVNIIKIIKRKKNNIPKILIDVAKAENKENRKKFPNVTCLKLFKQKYKA